MKTLYLAGLLVVVACEPTYAQATPAETLARYRQQYATPMSAAQIGELLNRVAWDFRGDGMKLLGKAAGANCPTPTGTRISCDYLVHGPSVTGHDVFRDAGPGGITQALAFTWGVGKEDLASAVRSGSRSLVDATLPDSTTDPGPGPQPDAGPPPGTYAIDLDVIRRLMVIEDKENQILLKLDAEVLAQLARIETTVDESGVSGGDIGRFIGKYLSGPAGVAILTWLAMRGSDPVVP